LVDQKYVLKLSRTEFLGKADEINALNIDNDQEEEVSEDDGI
jgi:hypothetical protein